MKTSLRYIALAAGVIGFTSTGAFAIDQYHEAGGAAWLTSLAGSASQPTNPGSAPTVSASAVNPAEFSEYGTYVWLGRVLAAPSQPRQTNVATTARAGHDVALLKDGSTVHIFADGKMGMEDRYGRPVSMAEGHSMTTADGRTVIMKGNEVWRVDQLLLAPYRGS